MIVQPYGPSSAYAWDTTAFAAGNYAVTVGIRNQGSLADYETADPGFVLASQPPCTGGVLAYDTASPAVAGTLVTATASVSCPGASEYQLWMQAPGGPAVIVQPYGSSSTYAWDTAGLTAGDYYITVGIRNQGSTADYETVADPVFTLTQ